MNTFLTHYYICPVAHIPRMYATICVNRTALKAVHQHINTSVLLLSLKSSQSIQCIILSVGEAFGCYWSLLHSLRRACSLWLSGWARSSQSHTLMSPCGSSLKHLRSQSEVFVCGTLAAQSTGSATNRASSEHTAASPGEREMYTYSTQHAQSHTYSEWFDVAHHINVFSCCIFNNLLTSNY